MMLQTIFRMVFFPLCLTLYVNSNTWAEEHSTSEHITPTVELSPAATESATPLDIPLSVESFRTSTGEANASNPSHADREISSETNEIVNKLTVETPTATPQTMAEDNTLQQVESLEESLQKITVMAKVLNSLGSEVDETLRSAALNVAEADKSNDKELYRQAVQAFEVLYEKQFGKTDSIPSVQGLAESLKKVEVMSKVIEVMNPEAKATVELSEAAKRVFAADNEGDKEAYHEAVEVFEALYQAAVSEKTVK
jgi:hypothetical protein